MRVIGFKVIGFAVVMLAVSVACGDLAVADTIRENTAGTSVSLKGYWGQSVVTGSGGGWNDIQLNFYDTSGNAQAFGTMFLLSTEYLGSPGGLSGSTNGFIASAADAGSTWDFASSVALESNTTYWFYTDGTAASVLVGNTSSGVAGEGHYFSTNVGIDYVGPFTGINFTLTGSTAPVPESGSIALLGLGLAGLAFARRRSKAMAS